MPEILPPKRVSTSTGLGLMDLGEASAEEVTLVRLVLKQVDVSEAELWRLVQNMPEKRRMSREVFDGILQKLVDKKWVWKTGLGESAQYSTRLKKRSRRTQMRLRMTQTSGSSISQIWALLEQRADQETAVSSTPSQPSLGAQLGAFFTERFAAGKIVFGVLLALAAVNSFAMATIEVTGVSGFVQSVGPQNLPWLTMAEMALGLTVSAAYLQVADRFPRLRLMKSMTAALVAIYLLTAGLFALAIYTPALNGLAAALNLDSGEALVYPLLYLVRSQQVILFPIAFWNLANNLYSMAEARQVFPAIASGDMLGQLVGYALFTDLLGRGALFDSHSAPILLALGAGLYLPCLALMQFALKEPEGEAETEKESFLENLREGWSTIRNVPLFRYLALAVTLVWLTFPLLEYHFYTSLDLAAEQGTSFENFYSIFSIANTLIILALQWRVIGALSKRVETRNSFFALPVTLALGVLLALLSKNLYVVAGGLLLSYIVLYSWDATAMSTLQNLIPEERRARVSTLLSNYSYAVGKIVGSLVLGLILLARPDSGTALAFVYLPVALVAALLAILAALLVRQTYEKSMLSWRIARRQRSASVLDKLDF